VFLNKKCNRVTSKALAWFMLDRADLSREPRISPKKDRPGAGY
jgi:hypothetical protein